MRPSLLPFVLGLSALLSFADGGAGVAAAATKAAPAQPTAARWAVDRGQSSLGFKSTFGGEPFAGRFSRWDAQITFDPKNLPASRVVVTIDMASAATGDADRDSTLPSSDWFDVARFPRATFTTTAIKDLGGGRYQAIGTLSLKGVNRPVTLPFSLAIAGDVARMTGQVVLNRSQFGVGKGQFAAADSVPFEVVVPISVVARRAR